MSKTITKKFIITLIIGIVLTVGGIIDDFAKQYAQYGNIFVNRFLQYTDAEIITVIGCIIIIAAMIILYKDNSF